MKTPKTTDSGNQVLVKVATCLYRSVASNIYYGIYKRTGKQVKRSLKTTDKELARRRLEHLRERVAQLNTKRGSNILLDDHREAMAGGHFYRPQRIHASVSSGNHRPTVPVL
ncbi:MAG: hypothetical protein HZA88_05020 [Verrucomicrobia bacterium]|nr:hypothetical protein [Verrucomicrobiota bacterium]